jgi:hypothetical protein
MRVKSWLPCTLLLLSLCLAPSSGAESVHVRLAYGADASEAVTVVWDSSNGEGPHQVDYGTSADLGTTAAATRTDLPAEDLDPVSARLTGLQAGATYHYRVTSGTLHGPNLTFRTAPKDANDLTFLAWGDQGADDEGRKVADAAAKTSADFALVLGDISYAERDAGTWHQYLDQMRPVFAKMPVMTVVGNHDWEGGLQSYTARFPMPGPGGAGWYALRYGRTILLGLDTEDLCRPYKDGGGAAPFDRSTCPSGVNQQQLDFLESTLKQARADPGVDWIVVAHHYGAYSRGKHGENPALQNVWVPLYEKYGVDLVLQGHDHLYLRSKPLRGGHEDRQGTTYVVVGTGGAAFYEYKDTPAWQAAGTQHQHGFLKVHIHGGSLDASFQSVHGLTLDTWSLKSRATSVAAGSAKAQPAPGLLVSSMFVALGAAAVLKRR